MKRTIFTLIVLMLLISSGLSQGLLVGVVTDSLTKEPLIGANIYLEGTALGASTDMDGAYRIEAVPYGSYTLVFSYLGYRTKKMAITVDSKKRTKIDAGLIYDVIEGEEVVITAQADGQAEAINKQITANSIINVVSEERIQELPDANAAEADCQVWLCSVLEVKPIRWSCVVSVPGILLFRLME